VVAHEQLTGRAPLDWRWFAPAAALSILTSPLTAVWFLLFGFLGLVVTAVVAARRADLGRRADAVTVGASLSLGVLVGPAMYLALALVIQI
jgi:hypothetical protein